MTSTKLVNGMTVEQLLDFHRQRFGTTRMEVEGEEGDGGKAEDEAGEQPESNGGEQQTFTQADVDRIVKKRADQMLRKELGGASLDDLKAKAAQYDKAQESAKTDEQKQAEETAKREREALDLRTENIRLRAAATYGVTGEDAEGVAYADLISGSDEQTVQRNAEALGRLIEASKELEAVKADGDRRRPMTGRPVGALRPGSTPPGTPLQASGAAGIAEAERRFGKQ